MVHYKDRHLEMLRALLLLKSQVSSDTFSSLIDAVDNEEAAERFRQIVAAARNERFELEDLLAEWARHARAGGRSAISDIGYRDIVTEWIALHESAAARAQQMADVAPTPEIAERLRALAAADARHAETLRALL